MVLSALNQMFFNQTEVYISFERLFTKIGPHFNEIVVFWFADNVNAHVEFVQIFKGIGYPTVGWFVCDTASFQNATKGVVFI